MNRVFLIMSAAGLPLLVDASLKGGALLVLAAGCALILRRASAAARHVVWLAAVLALLLVPVLSVVLPGWRVLPEWVSVETPSYGTDGTDGTDGIGATHAPVLPAVESASVPQLPAHAEGYSSHSAHSSHVLSPAPPALPAAALPAPAPAPQVAAAWLFPAWAAGCVLLLLRLAVARWLLWRACRRCETAAGPLAQAFITALRESGVRQPVRLLLDARRTIPVVWGIFRPRLLLPSEAHSWDAAQLRSVLMHELAHLRRRDPLVHVLTQIACALHWFNPLVWLAAWRLHVERERACDDLVLASGVRPSDYAGHLLHVATKLSPARWTAACGLAMARKSSLEGRLLAVLSERLNRGGLTRALTAAAILLSVAIAIPVAMLRGQDEKQAAALASDDKNKKDAQHKADPSGMKLDPGTEAQLDWGEAVNGLRGAVIIRGEPPAIYLAVQNGSEAAIRFADTTKAERLRTLYLSDSKGILFALTSDEPTQTDVQLQPREVAFLRMMPPVKDPGEKSVEPALIEGLRKDSLQTWKVVLEVEKAPEGAWKGKLITAETRGGTGTDGPHPKTEAGRALFKHFQEHARLNGDIPGGLLSRLHDKVKEFIRNNSGDASGGPYAKKMAPLEARFGATGDWKPADVVALLDDIAAAHTIPLEMTMVYVAERRLQRGQPLPAALAKADWGEPLPGGLRAAYLLEPRQEAYHLGTEVKVRILLHNSGKEPVTFFTSSFQQPGHKAKLGDDGAEFTVESTYWTTLGSPEGYRLWPGEYCETNTPGIGIGARNKDRDDWANVRAGSWIHCGEGDDVAFHPGPVLLASDRSEIDSGPQWWLEFIAERLGRELPVPADKKEREYLLYRVARELFGTAPSVDEGNAFAADKSPDALGNLAVMLSKRKYIVPTHGPISAGVTRFRVLPPDADAAKRPRVAMSPGTYNLGDGVRLFVTRSHVGQRIVNDGSVAHYPKGEYSNSHDLKLPDGYETWAAGMAPGSTVLWVTQKGLLRKIDFTDPAKVAETRYEADKAAEAPIPPDIREALRAALIVPDAPKQEQKQKPEQGAESNGTKEQQADPNAGKAPATAADAPKTSQTGKLRLPKLPDEAYTRTGVHCQKFREEDAKRPGGELMGNVSEARQGDGPLVPGLRVASDAKWNIGGKARVELVVRNASSSDVKFAQTPRSDNGLSVMAIAKDGKEYQADIAQFDGLLVMNHLLLPPAHIVAVKSFTLRFDSEKNGASEPGVAAFHLPPGKYTLRCKWKDARPDVSHEGEWTGELENGELAFTLTAVPPANGTPKTGDAGQRRKVDWSKPPPLSFFKGTFDPELLARLAEKPERLNEDSEAGTKIWPLSEQILRASVERDPQFRHLLANEKLKAQDIDNRILTMSLAAYDYSVFGNKAGLKVILDQLENGPHEAYLAAFPLGFVDEWEQSLPVIDRCFARADGAKGEEHTRFWVHRKWLFPESFALFQEKRLESKKLDAGSLRGVWKGSKDGVSVTLRFGENQGWEVRQGEKVLKSELSTKPSLNSSVLFLIPPPKPEDHEKFGGPGDIGTLYPGKDGTMLLYIRGFFGQVATGYPRVNDLILTKEADAPKGADAGHRRKVDWSTFPHYSTPEIPFADPFVPEDAVRLAAAPNKSKQDIQRLEQMVLQAAVEKAVELRPLLRDEGLKRSDHSLALALAAYDYSVNGNKTALQYVLDELAVEDHDRAERAAWTLRWIDEWELTQAAYDKHFSRIAGSVAEEYALFWEQREFLFPESYARAHAKQLAEAKIDAASLRGVWKGGMDGMSVEIRLGDKNEWEIRQGEKNFSKAELRTHSIPEHSTVELHTQKESKSGFPFTFAWLKPGGDGTLRLHLYRGRSDVSPDEPQVTEVVLRKQNGRPEGPEPPKLDSPAPGEPKGVAADVESGAKLNAAIEAQLDWGEEVNGLRGAVVVRSPEPGTAPGIYLAVQNVSAAAIRVSDTTKAEKLRKLYLSDSKGILFALTSDEPTQTNVRLQPREVAFLRMMPTEKTTDEKSPEAFLIEGLRKDSLQTWRAILEIEKAPEGAWKGKLTTAETRGAVGTEGPQPKSKEARALFKLWQDHARLNGDIPGGLLSRLHDKVKEFIRNNTGDASGDPYAKKMAPIEPRFGAARDWKPADVVALMDDIAAVTTIPLDTTMDHMARRTLQGGPPLPAALANADWGEPLPGGLRMAFRLEPRAQQYHLGTEVKARILLHNSGKDPVVFVTRSFHQPGHKAKRADGQELTLDSTFWTTLGRAEAYRLEPGEYGEANTPGIGIGARNNDNDDWSNVRAGSWILCEEGDEVTLLPGPVMLTADESPGESRWWLEFITERLSREAPVPPDAKERTYLLYRVVRDLFGTAPSVDEGNAFRADQSPDALSNLAAMLAKREYIVPTHGPVSAGATKFRVLPPDPDAGKRPRVAMNPGRYTLGEEVRFVVTRRPAGERIVNEADVTYYPRGRDNIPHAVKLPDGYNTWAAAWGPGTTVLWVTEKGLLRKIDFANPAQVQETRFEADNIANAPIPTNIREALRAALAVSDAPKPANEDAAPKPATPPAPSERLTQYEVQKGDTLYVIGKKFGITAQQLKAFNGLEMDTIRVGQVLKIPTPAPAARKQEPQ